MALVLTEEQSMLRDSARSFLSNEAPVSHLRALRDAKDPKGFSPGLWMRCTEMGFAGVLIGEEHGGLGLSLVEAAVIAEELGRTLAPVPFLSSAVLGAGLLQAGGPARLAGKWLAEIAAGKAIVALAIDEQARHRPDRIATTAIAAGGSYRLDGEKAFVVDGHVAQLLLVVARTGEGRTVFAVDPTAKGVHIERTTMVDAHNAARVRLAGVEVAADDIVGEAGRAQDLVEGVLDAGRVCVAAQLVGAAEEAFQRTLAYLKERQQFGRKIGEFQSLQHRASMLYCDLELARAAMMRAAEAVQSGRDARAAVSVAKAKACRTASLAVQEGVQMHGGIGMTDAFEMGFFMKRVRVLQDLLGDASFHDNRLADLSGY